MSFPGRMGLQIPGRILTLGATAVLILVLAAGGCGQTTPEQTVYKFLGAAQTHDFPAMRSCVNPEARNKVERDDGRLRQEWEELQRRFQGGSPDWRFQFEGIKLRTDPLDPEHVLVTITDGSCVYYRLRGDRWVKDGEIDFSSEEFIPLYLVKKGGEWYLEALDLYVLYALETAARM